MREFPLAGRRLIEGAAVIVAAISMIAAGESAVSASPAGPAAVPEIGQYSSALAPVGAEPISATKAAMKSQMSPHATAAYATSKALGIEYLQQPSSSSWCGPTTVADIADYHRMGWGGTSFNKEKSAANLMGVTEYGPGTPWHGSDSIPIYPYSSSNVMEDTLNYLIWRKWNHSWYSEVGLASSPSSSDVSTYKNNLEFDINTSLDGKVGMPIAANEYAAPGYQLQKQPSGIWIMHWFAASGYYSSGAGTYFSDPGWGGGTRSQDSSSRVVTALGGRGYVW